MNRLGYLGIAASAMPKPLVEKSEVGPITYEQVLENLGPTTSYLTPKPTSFWESAKQTAASPFGTVVTTGEEVPLEYKPMVDEVMRQRAAGGGSASDVVFTTPQGQATTVQYSRAPMFKANILQPMQPGFTAEQQQSLNPVAYAQRQAAQSKDAPAPSSNKTLYIIGGVVVGLALLYFMFKDKK